MAILHSIWTEAGQLFLWGEQWRKVDRFGLADWTTIAPIHPLSLSELELQDLLASLGDGNPCTAEGYFTEITLPLPTALDDTERLLPWHSVQALPPDTPLVPWRIQGYLLSSSQALPFLLRLPLGAEDFGKHSLGQELRYWSHVARWVLDLTSRSQFIPTLYPELLSSKTLRAGWTVRLEQGDDRLRFDRFVQQMPPVAYWVSPKLVSPNNPPDPAPLHSALACPLPQNPRHYLGFWLNTMIDHRVRTIAQTLPRPAIDPLFQDFWQALQCNSDLTPSDNLDPDRQEDWERWGTLVQRWSHTDDLARPQPIRPGLKLHPPQESASAWVLEYGLHIENQTASDFIPAAILWQNPQETGYYQGYTIPQPQELLLRGLGLALRIYPFLEASLDTPEPVGCELPTAEIYPFLQRIAPRLEDQGLAVILPPGLSRGQGVANRLGLQITAALAAPSGQTLGLGNLLQFRWELCLGGQTFSKAAFDRLVAQDTPLIQVNGEWLELRPQDVAAAQEFFKHRKNQPNLSLEDALRLSTGDTPTLSKLPVVNFEATGALQDLVTTLTGNQPAEPLAAPAGFQGQLRPYQERGAGWLHFLHRWNLGACLADDMGLGKTIQFIAFLLHLSNSAELERPYLLICPTSVLGNWERELKRFAPQLNLWIHHGEKRLKGHPLKTIVLKQQLVLTSYALVYRDLADLKTIPWQGVVLDEAQNIKNSESKQSIAVRELALVNLAAPGKESPYPLPFRIALTGTPVENHLTELWSIMEFLNPGYLGTKAFFQRRFTIPIERYGDRASLQALRSMVQPFILRRLKTDRSIIQDLPEKQEMTVFCGLSQEQADLYQTVVEETLTAVDSATGIEKQGLILGLLTKLKQICNHPSLFLKETIVPQASKKSTAKSQSLAKSPLSEADLQHFQQRSSKVQRLEALLEELFTEGETIAPNYVPNRALLFTQFAEWGKLLKIYFEQRWKREVLFLYGATPKRDRQLMIDRFQEDPQAPRLLILSLKAGGVGLNLTRANHVFHIDRWWNPAVENQATDRAFRIGQTRKVQVHKFVCSGTLEERIHDIMENKKALAEQIVGTGENWLTQLNTDQLRELLLLNRDTIE